MPQPSKTRGAQCKLAEFQEVKPIREVKDEGQDCISLYWFVKSKPIDGKSVFEEGQDFLTAGQHV